MKKFLFFVLGLVVASNAIACFYQREEISGMNKICYYQCVNGTRAITISAVSLCPLSLNRPEIGTDLATRILKSRQSISTNECKTTS